MPAGKKVVIRNVLDLTIVNFEETRILDAAQIDRIGAELFPLVDSMGRKKLVLDFTKVQFLASAAVGMLIKLHKKTSAINGTLVICGLRKELLRLFEIMDLLPLFKFCANEGEALSAFGYTPAG